MSKIKPGTFQLDPALVAAHFTKPEHRYINRELSWLAFNTRVLEEAQNPANPLLERIKFLSISATNLDEFTMVRIAGLMDQVAHGVHSPSADGLSPIHQLHSIHHSVIRLITAQQKCWLTLRKELADEGVQVISAEKLPKALNKVDLAWLKEYFTANIFPLLTPIAVDPAHPFPFIPRAPWTTYRHTPFSRTSAAGRARTAAQPHRSTCSCLRS